MKNKILDFRALCALLLLLPGFFAAAQTATLTALAVKGQTEIPNALYLGTTPDSRTPRHHTMVIATDYAEILDACVRAFNERDLASFTHYFSDSVKVYNYPSSYDIGEGRNSKKISAPTLRSIVPPPSTLWIGLSSIPVP